MPHPPIEFAQSANVSNSNPPVWGAEGPGLPPQRSEDAVMGPPSMPDWPQSSQMCPMTDHEVASRPGVDGPTQDQRAGEGGHERGFIQPQTHSNPTTNAPGNFMCDNFFFNEEMGDDCTPAKSGADLAIEKHLSKRPPCNRNDHIRNSEKTEGLQTKSDQLHFSRRLCRC